MVNIAVGKIDDGVTAARRAVEISRRSPFFLGLLGWALAEAGEREEAEVVLDEIHSRRADFPLLPFEACILAAFGDKEAALAILAQTIDEYQPIACYLGLPCYDRLRDDPRFALLAERIGVHY